MHDQVQMRRKETILRKIEARQMRQAERSQLDKESNKLLTVIKEQNRKRREQMESLVSKYK